MFTKLIFVDPIWDEKWDDIGNEILKYLNVS